MDRDTETAIRCYLQPRNRDQNKPSHGDIHAYRLSLRYEHTGVADILFQEPQTLECVKKTCSIGEHMWKIYSGEEVIDMEGVQSL